MSLRLAPLWTVRHGDCVELMRGMPECSVDAVVTDPPYGIGFMGKSWDHSFRRSANEHDVGRKNVFGRTSRVAPSLDDRKMLERGQGGSRSVVHGFSVESKSAFADWTKAWCEEVLRVLKPGGHIIVFGGTRTYHWLSVGIELSGFEIRDCLMWIYGSGFPKSKNLDGGWQGWGTALKPAWEPIILARKPLSGTVAANVLMHGTGALNIDGCRIGFRSDSDEQESKQKNRHADFGSGPRDNKVFGEDLRSRADQGNYDPSGRWPANLVLDDVAAQLLDDQAVLSVSRIGKPRVGVNGHGWGMTATGAEYNDSGGPSRFFYCAKASTAERNAGLDERNSHPTVKPVDLMRWLVRLITPAGGLVLDPFMGSGTTLVAATLEGFDSVGIDQDDGYCAIALDRCRYWEGR